MVVAESLTIWTVNDEGLLSETVWRMVKLGELRGMFRSERERYILVSPLM
jgi:hypothetical protein